MASTGRRTQAERRAQSLTRILDAAVESLVDVGYAATTTLEVQRRAGVSRGQLLYYFPSRAELLVAAMGHLFESRVGELRDLASTLPAGEDRIPAAIAALWQTYRSDLFAASMELWVAARTDPELRTALLPHERRIGSESRRIVADLLGPELAARPGCDAAIQLMTQLMRGAAVALPLTSASRRDPGLELWADAVRSLLAPASPIHGPRSGPR